MWAFSRRLLSQNKLITRYLLRKNESIVGCFTSKPAFVREKQDDTNDKAFNISKLFEPTQLKESTDTDIGIELTGQINNSDVLKVLNQFSSKEINRNLCLEYGLDRE